MRNSGGVRILSVHVEEFFISHCGIGTYESIEPD